MGLRKSPKAFSLLELLVVIAVVAVLLSVLLPALVVARASSYRALCASNLRQLSIGWQGYLAEHKETFPQYGERPDWSYGGVDFVGPERVAVLASDRPINRHVLGDQGDGRIAGGRELSLFRCPADAGVTARGGSARGLPGESVLPERTCYQTFGTSYRANPNLLDSTAAGIDALHRPLKLHEVRVDVSRLLLVGDPAWWFASRALGHADDGLDASWHRQQDAGNVLTVDGAVRFIDFGRWLGEDYRLPAEAERDIPAQHQDQETP